MERFGELKENHEGTWIARLRSNDSSVQKDGGEYLPIKTANGQHYHGGYQNWWSAAAKEKELREQGVKSRYQICCRDENFRLANLGCGVIAVINMELYLGRKKGLKETALDLDGEITQESYQKYAIPKWEKTYHIGKSYLNYVAGLYPWKIESGLKKFLRKHNFSRRRVKWAPFFPNTNERQKKLTLEAMKDMLLDDYPVMIAYYSKKDNITLYVNLEHAIRGLPAENRDEETDSHYMTVIGLYLSDQGKVIMQLESWGRIYYVRYDDFSRTLNYFSNFLRIY